MVSTIPVNEILAAAQEQNGTSFGSVTKLPYQMVSQPTPRTIRCWISSGKLSSAKTPSAVAYKCNQLPLSLLSILAQVLQAIVK
jgi:hypothetical protein